MNRILFASSEVVPFIKTGGLADVVGSLPKYFPKDEYDVRVVLPKYACMDPKYCEGMELVSECQVQLSWRRQYAGILKLVHDGVTFYFIDNEYYFAGPHPYGEIYQDAEKFAYFSRAVLTILPIIDFQPDIIHCNDWHTGLVPVFLTAFYRNDPFYKYIRTVFTIHNLKFQGRWYIDAIKDVTGLPQEYFNMNTLESYGQANLLKGGVVFADYVTTVSETYAKEILSIDGGEGLDGLFRMRSFRTQGILNGLNYMDQDPSADTRIACRFDGNIAAYKKANKAALQTELGLEQREDAFLIGMVSRLTDQKGFDLVDYILDEIMGMERVQIVVLGTGEQRYEDQFRFYQGKYPGRLSANIFYSEDMAQRIYASCDAFLMPSLFEPCGLSQLMAMRYGTVPLVRETGGLKDTVEPYNEFEHTGTGFTFHNYNAHEMLYMIRYAEKIFTQYPDEWMDMIRRDMETDYSWESSCRKYMVLYEALLTETKEQKAEEIKKQKEAEEAEKRRREEELRIKILMEKEAAGAAKKTKEAEAAKTKKKAAAAKQTGKKKAADSAKASSEKSASAKTAVGDASAKTAVKKTSARITVKK